MTALKWIGWFCIIFVVFTFAGFTCGWFKDAAKTAKENYSPSVMLKRYEYFKDLSASIDENRATIEVYHEELKDYKVLTKDDKFYYEQRKSELIGIISIHNGLCRDYNSAMAKFNYRFTNRGDLPESNLDPLPREFKPYILKL